MRVREGTSYVGQRLRRKEDRRHLLGRGRFLADLRPTGALEVAFLRSPHAHARLLELDTRAARVLPGVIAVITGTDWTAVKPFTHGLAALPGVRPLAWPVLPTDVVRHVGEPVAAVVAVDRYRAEDALDAIVAEYAPLPAVTDAEAAGAPDAPLLFPEWGDNVFYRRGFAHGPMDAVFAEARHIVRARLRSQRYSGFPLETRGYLAEWDPGTETLCVWASTQWPHAERTVLAELLELPESRLRVIAPDVGGGFGNKQHTFREELAVCLLARQLGAAVQWIEDRRENLAASLHAREQQHEIELAVDADGVLLGVRDHIIADLGAPTVYFSGIGPQLVTASAVPGPYRVRAYAYELECRVTNKCPAGSYRGFGRPPAVFVMERMLDVVARRLGLDPAEVRRRNLVAPEEMPYQSVTGAVLDSGQYAACLERALAAVDYTGWRAAQERCRADGELLGIGIACLVEGTAANIRGAAGRWGAYDAATARLEPDGSLTVFVGVSPHGQGLETTLAQVAADALGVPPTRVTIRHGDTETCPYGLGTWGSRSAVVGGVSVAQATRGVRAAVLQIAAALLEAGVNDLELADDRVWVRGVPERGLPLAEVARVAYHHTARLPGGVGPGLQATAVYDPPSISRAPDAFGRLNNNATASNATHVAVVRVDRATGDVRLLRYVVAHDCGTVINPTIVDGQVHGGVAQGIGGALYETLIYDDNGQLLTASLLDYRMPGATEVPSVVVEHLETPSPFVEGGFKGMGEGGAIGAPAAVANAVADALAPLGVEVWETPLTPARVLALIAAAEAAAP